ncbi:MAG: bifunctional oligoribonuclease/PAP phosphatase NrnA [Candidatus Auribacterota bacterium]|jgi:phosphoesterase RecJ-like protein|nr:bifunctional oligoribonuclease/PAP phosphatase NrnA [Candidatus Auribacterota bacterium]
MMNWAPIVETLNRYQTFVISSHIGLEGDAVGSEIAVARLLRNMGKKTAVIHHDAVVPVSLRYLVDGELVLCADDEQSGRLINDCDAVVIVDVSNWDHLGNAGLLIRNSGKPVVCIDHHKSENPIGDHAVVDSTASSTGVMIYDLVAKFPPQMFDTHIAKSIYTTILTDTGNFRFSNTNARAYRIAADLIDRGVDHAQICKELYQNDNWGRYRLMHLVLGTLSKDADGKIASMQIDKQMLKNSGASYADSEGFVDMARCIRDVEVSLLFREVSMNETKVTFRSKQYVDVQAIAQLFGGGGHTRAAGALVHADMKQAIETVIAEVKKVI